MALDNTQRAILSIAALSHLADMKKKLVQNDPEGLCRVGRLERLVINGTVSERDQILKWYEMDASFDRALQSIQPQPV
jgi:hypothetical protein